MEELKPCKCGSVDIHEEVMSDNKSHIACQVCGFEIITDYPEWSFELWNTRAKEVIMSEPLCDNCGGEGRYVDHHSQCHEPCTCGGVEYQCEKCNGSGRMVMSEPLKLSKVLGLERINIDLYKSPVFRAEILGRNKALDDLDQLSPDVIELAKIIHQESGSVESWETCSVGDRDYAISVAQEIINKMSVWIVKKGN